MNEVIALQRELEGAGSSVSCRMRLGSSKVFPEAMAMRISCAFASSRLT